MQYDAIIVELLSRIKVLEEEVAQLKESRNVISQDEDTEVSSSVEYKKTTDEMLEMCYKAGKMIGPEIKAADLADAIAEETGMNKNSAIMYLYAVNGLLEGKIFKRAISATALEKYLDTIFSEYGSEGLKKAIKATKLHIDYRKQYGITSDAIEKVCKKAEEKL